MHVGLPHQDAPQGVVQRSKDGVSENNSEVGRGLLAATVRPSARRSGRRTEVVASPPRRSEPAPMATAVFPGFRRDTSPSWQGARRVGGHMAHILVWAGEVHDGNAAFEQDLAWGEAIVADLDGLDEQARALVAEDVVRAGSVGDRYCRELAKLKGFWLPEDFGDAGCAVDTSRVHRTLRLRNVVVELAARRITFDYGIGAGIWRDMLSATIAEDGGLLPLACLAGGRAGALLANPSRMQTWLHFPHDLTDDELTWAVASIGVPGLTLEQTRRGVQVHEHTTEILLEGGEDALAIARMLRDALGRAVVLSDMFFLPWQLLLLDPQRGEWLLDDDERCPGGLFYGLPPRLDMWSQRPAGATGVRPAGWVVPTPDEPRRKPPIYTSMVVPRDVPLELIENAGATAGATVVWASDYGDDNSDLRFACLMSVADGITTARALAATLQRAVAAGDVIESHPDWVLVEPDGRVRRVAVTEDAPGGLRPGEYLEDTRPTAPLPAPPWLVDDGAGGAQTSTAPPVYTTLLLPKQLTPSTIESTMASIAVPDPVTVLWQRGSWQGPLRDLQLVSFRSRTDELTLARAVADVLRCPVGVVLSLRGDPGWVFTEPGRGEWVAAGDHWWEEGELRYLRPFEETDWIQ